MKNKNYRTSGININQKNLFYYKNTFKDITNEKSKFFYEILVQKKFKCSNMESVWSKLFNILNDSNTWEKIYYGKVINEKYKKFSDFNYKQLHNILPSGTIVNKWNKNVTPNCAYCNEKEDIKHILFDCTRVKEIWEKIGLMLKMKIQWKHIVVGYFDQNNTTEFRNLIFNIVNYSIYSQWVKCSENDDLYRNTSMYTEIKVAILFYKKVYSHVENVNFNILFKKLCDDIRISQ